MEEANCPSHHATTPLHVFPRRQPAADIRRGPPCPGPNGGPPSPDSVCVLEVRDSRRWRNACGLILHRIPRRRQTAARTRSRRDSSSGSGPGGRLLLVPQPAAAAIWRAAVAFRDMLPRPTSSPQPAGPELRVEPPRSRLAWSVGGTELEKLQKSTRQNTNSRSPPAHGSGGVGAPQLLMYGSGGVGAPQLLMYGSGGVGAPQLLMYGSGGVGAPQLLMNGSGGVGAPQLLMYSSGGVGAPQLLMYGSGGV